MRNKHEVERVVKKRPCVELRPKRSDAGQEEKIDTNVCCQCGGSYEQDIMEGTGADWLACACGRWLHEECVEDCIRDAEGNECLCTFCLDHLAL